MGRHKHSEHRSGGKTQRQRPSGAHKLGVFPPVWLQQPATGDGAGRVAGPCSPCQGISLHSKGGMEPQEGLEVAVVRSSCKVLRPLWFLWVGVGGA